MALTKEEENNIAQIHSFLQNNDIDPSNIMGYSGKFTIFYYIGDSRKFAEDTRVIFSIVGENTIIITLNEINHIEYETEFKTTEKTFNYDDDNETLTIIGNDSTKHNEEYKIVINSIYLDLL